MYDWGLRRFRLTQDARGKSEETKYVPEERQRKLIYPASFCEAEDRVQGSRFIVICLRVILLCTSSPIPLPPRTTM